MATEPWKDYAKSVKPLRKKKREDRPPAKTATMQTARAAARQNAENEPRKLPKTHTAEGFLENVSAPLNRKREKSLRQGALPIDAKIDLHGLTQTEAFETLANFMKRCVRTQKRVLLIVTGKGSLGNGVLKKNLETWLSQLPESKDILALRQAAAQHGSEGAFYVVLRKPKTTV